MKKNFLWILSFAFLGLTTITTFYSCETDACADVVCVNADCFEGECICQVGFVKDANGDCVPECNDADCGENAQCENNVCTCIIGYEENANGVCVLEKEKFIGSYDVTDVCDSGTYTYEVTVDELIGSTDVVRIQNLSDLQCEDANGNPVDYFVEATVFEASLSFTDYTTCGATWTGNGTMESGVITMTYSLINPDDNCTATLTKK